MSTIQGIVEQLDSRPAGRGTAYRIKVQGSFYGCGFNPPACNQGDQVQFNVMQNDKGYWNVQGPIQVLQQGAGPAQPAPQANAGGNQAPNQRPQGAQQAVQGGSREQYWQDKEKRDVVTQKIIQYQASRNAAIEVVTAALANDGLSLGTKKAERLDNLIAVIHEVTDIFEKDNEDIKATGTRTGEYNKAENVEPETDQWGQ